jgi:hypothetical protein
MRKAIAVLVVVLVAAVITLPAPGSSQQPSSNTTRANYKPLDASAFTLLTPSPYVVEPIEDSHGASFPTPTDRPKVAVTQPVQSIPKTPAVPKIPSVGSYMSTAESIQIAKAYARSRVSGSQFSCLDNLWERESSWYYKAENPSSGAYGIPQALPGSKMASAGDDWRTNPITQVKWGLGYISGRYGTPCEAWAFFKANNWY